MVAELGGKTHSARGWKAIAWALVVVESMLSKLSHHHHLSDPLTTISREGKSPIRVEMDWIVSRGRTVVQWALLRI